MLAARRKWARRLAGVPSATSRPISSTGRSVVSSSSVLDPATMARPDVERLRAAPGIPDEVAIAAYVYDLATGLVRGA
jgi:hypothetical protein